jgi:hypothetical protein
MWVGSVCAHHGACHAAGHGCARCGVVCCVVERAGRVVRCVGEVQVRARSPRPGFFTKVNSKEKKTAVLIGLFI